MRDANQTKNAIILGITADIGFELAKRLLKDGWTVVGLGRDLKRISGHKEMEDVTLVSCDLGDNASVDQAVAEIAAMNIHWTLFVSSAGTMEPIGSFFDLDFDAVEKNLKINTLNQLRVLHGLWPHRKPDTVVDVMLLAGGGTNGPFRNYSAYCVSKIALIKMCELIHDETEDANAFIIGPGYTRTRIHDETLRAGRTAAGVNFEKTKEFLADSNEPGTSFDDIYKHMVWCMRTGREVSGGRNFSTVHDPWRNPEKGLESKLLHDRNTFRLRRHDVKN